MGPRFVVFWFHKTEVFVPNRYANHAMRHWMKGVLRQTLTSRMVNIILRRKRSGSRWLQGPVGNLVGVAINHVFAYAGTLNGKRICPSVLGG